MAAIPNPIIEQTYRIPVVGGATLGLNNIGTSGAQVIGSDQNRKSISFGRPNGSVTLYVYQPVDLNGNTLAPSNGSPGGAEPILAGAILTFTGAGVGNADDRTRLWISNARHGHGE